MGPALVTGASGFIGQHLVSRLLADGLAVRALARTGMVQEEQGRKIEVVRGDVRDIQVVRKAVRGVKSVIHLAGKVHDAKGLNPTSEHEEVTLGGTRNLMLAAGENGVKKFVFLSSLSVYGTNSQVVQDETAAYNPASGYGRAKLQADQFVLDSGRQFGMHVCCLRPAMVYGPGCKGDLPRMIAMIERGLFPPLPNLGNWRSMVHVTDLVEAAILAATKPVANGRSYIVTDGKPYSTREIYDLICRGLGKPIPRWHMPMGILKALGYVGDAIGRVRGGRFLFDSDALEKLIGSAWFSSEKISRELGYRPSVTFQDAIPELIAWYRKALV